MGVVMDISDHIVVLDFGKKIADGDRDTVRRDPTVIRAYLGEEDERLRAAEREAEAAEAEAEAEEAPPGEPEPEPEPAAAA
jgi:branched-chain amino acid transport system ATP-binding protein